MSALSVVVVAHDMARELPRTLRTLQSGYQLDAPETEIVVVDNGSPVPAALPEDLDRPAPRLISIPASTAAASPAAAANEGIAAARNDLIGLWIDGARMASPGLLGLAAGAASLSDRVIVATTAYHLGDEPQMTAAARGYDQTTEDALLDSVDWEADGYGLFGISCLAGSSQRGWFGPMGESNALFMHRSLWNELGGLDEVFARPGGGLVNHDLYRRACELDDTELVLLLGEGTFHQYHGGAATSGRDTHEELWAEYEAIRGQPYRPPDRAPRLFGHVPHEAIAHLERSIAWLRDH